MQLFVDESGPFNIAAKNVRFNVVAGLALPESPAAVTELVALQVARLEERAPTSWRKNGELKGALIPREDLRELLNPILAFNGPVFVVAAFIDQAYQARNQIDVYKSNRLSALEHERQCEIDPKRQQHLAEEIGFVRDASSPVLMRSYVALPQIVVNTMVLMQAYYPPEFWPPLERLEVIVDRDSFLKNHSDRQRVVKQRVIEELARHKSQWGFAELRQWRERNLQHPGERLAAQSGSPGSWQITLDFDLDADEAGRPLMLFGDFVAAAIRRDLEAATDTNTPDPIVFASRRVFPAFTILGTFSDAEQRTAMEALMPLLAAWGVHFGVPGANIGKCAIGE